MKKTLIATTALLATAGTTVLVAAPANADVEKRGTCAGATYELNVDRERGGFEVDADLDNARVGSEWRVAIRHDGRLAISRVLRADNEGELDLGVYRKNSAGTDTFKLTVTPVGGTSCSMKVTLR
ncbi:hypothetical protein SAMN05192575_10941 [Nocardioides alpinus]|uniref:Uncharacterized protein n=1 Tax=Nocardioides alpinus TaxID=748909 RepID=A0A1I1ALR0_9ACTN|nr:hypothetical protein [Nocardioides alpinus]PKH41013.1 hypothetical protein CXG46_11225 [Nocardioides alpinus]SFB37350.1 hypothetical protein SAMN05192575_10941 [Nocardioides alpinus]